MAFDATAATERIKNFNIHSVTYKTVHAVPLTVDIVIPRALPAGKYPVIVRFHGGFLMTGSSLFLGMFAPWVLDYAEKKKAIIVNPNYRKLPEAKGKDLLNDLDDFWAWVKRDLARDVGIATGGKLEVDSERTLVVGQSAGKSSSSYNSPLTHHTFWMPEVAYEP